MPTCASIILKFYIYPLLLNSSVPRAQDTHTIPRSTSHSNLLAPADSVSQHACPQGVVETDVKSSARALWCCSLWYVSAGSSFTFLGQMSKITLVFTDGLALCREKMMPRRLQRCTHPARRNKGQCSGLCTTRLRGSKEEETVSCTVLRGVICSEKRVVA